MNYIFFEYLYLHNQKVEELSLHILYHLILNLILYKLMDFIS